MSKKTFDDLPVRAKKECLYAVRMGLFKTEQNYVDEYYRDEGGFSDEAKASIADLNRKLGVSA